MLCYGVVVVDLLDHLDVKLFLPLRKLGLKDHEEIVSILILEGDPLCEGRHLARGQVDPAFDLSGPVGEEEHVGVVFSPEVFEPAHDADGVEALAIEGGVLLELVGDLVEREGDDSLVADWFVVFFGRIRHLPPDKIIAYLVQT